MKFTVWIWVHWQVISLILCCIVPILFLLVVGFCLRFNPIYLLSIIIPITIIISLWPVGQLDLSTWLLPYTGMLSLTSLLLIWDALEQYRQCYRWQLLTKIEQCLIYNSSIVLGLSVYPTTLGLFNIELYSLGFTGVILPSILGIVAGIAWIYHAKAIAYLLLAVLWAWLLNLGESQNLWDYVLDPWLFLYSIMRYLSTYNL